jgi:hypothetical protein
MTESKEVSGPSATSISTVEFESKEGMGTGAKVGIGIGVLVGIALLVLVVYLLLDNPGTTETIRDLFIIVLALETFAIGTLVVVLIFQVIALVRMVRDELQPMVDSTQETLNTVKGTTTFVSERVTQPVIEAMSYSKGVGTALGVLFDLLPRRGRRPPKSE